MKAPKAKRKLTFRAKKRKRERLSIDASRLPECGPFELQLRGWRFTQSELKKVNIPDKQFVVELSGVSVFRDQFRILPYGEQGNDWLGLARPSPVTSSTPLPRSTPVSTAAATLSQGATQGRDALPDEAAIPTRRPSHLSQILNEVPLAPYRTVSRQHRP
ncbi:MAG: hypothetical protein IPG47_11090 [Thermoflexaceae bacterium]|nr:hypothetical protein [Thermoflexaceae bacterium]